MRKLLDRLFYSDRKIDRFLEGSLPEAERDLVEKRCLEDEAFFRRVQEREALRLQVARTIAEKGETFAAVKTAPAAGPKAGRIRHSFAPGRRIGWAYALLAAALLCLCLYLIVPNRGENVAVNEELERQLGARVLRGDTVQVLSPALPAQAGSEILFSWRLAEKGPFKVLILDSRAEEIDSLSTDGLSVRYPVKLPPGVYYWKLLQNDDWIYTGKIIVARK